MVEDIQNPAEKEKFQSLETILDNSIQRLKSELSEKFKEILLYLENEHKKIKSIAKYYFVPIDDLNLPIRPYKRLKEVGIDVIGKLIQKSEKDLLSTKSGFGKKSLYEVKQALARYGLSLRCEYK